MVRLPVSPPPSPPSVWPASPRADRPTRPPPTRINPPDPNSKDRAMPMYLPSGHHSPAPPPPPPEDMQKTFEQVDVFNAEVQAAGAWVFAGGLFPPEIAT